MAKAPSLREDRNKGTQRTRKLYTENKPRWMLRQWEGTLGEERVMVTQMDTQRPTEGAEPCKVKALSTVLNGGGEETYL